MRHRKNCESCPTQVAWKVKFKCQICLSVFAGCPGPSRPRGTLLLWGSYSANNGERKEKNEIIWLSNRESKQWRGFLFYNVIPILPRSRVTQMDECSKLLQYRSNFLQRPLSCFKRSSEAGFRLFDVKKIYFWKQQCMLLATGKYRIFFQFLPAPHSLQNQNQNKTNEMSQPGALVNEEFHGATASCGWLQINLKVGMVS